MSWSFASTPIVRAARQFSGRRLGSDQDEKPSFAGLMVASVNVV
jgi:hypothetical protein